MDISWDQFRVRGNRTRFGVILFGPDWGDRPGAVVDSAVDIRRAGVDRGGGVLVRGATLPRTGLTDFVAAWGIEHEFTRHGMFVGTAGR